MKLGIHLPNFTPLDGAEPTRRIAQAAERLGFDSLWTGDNVAVPLRGQHPYSYSRDRKHPVEPGMNLVDPLVSLTVAAGCTEHIDLGTTVLVMPYRNPVLLAKTIASIDMLTGRRIWLGVGVGAGDERWDILNLPGYRERGAVTDEYIRVLRACWEEETPSFEGRYYRLEPIYFKPKPQRPIPIWIGGNSPAAMRRAARLGDGWHPLRLKPDELAAAIAAVKRYAVEYGRDPDSIEFSMSCVLDVLDEGAERQSLRDLIGPPEHIATMLRRWEDIGLTHLAINFTQVAIYSLQAMLDSMERFTELVRPLLS